MPTERMSMRPSGSKKSMPYRGRIAAFLTWKRGG